MTEIERKALALVNEVRAEGRLGPTTLWEVRGDAAFRAFARAVEQHEIYRREVSDAMTDLDSRIGMAGYAPRSMARLIAQRFIIPKPEPVNPLVEVIATALRDGSPFDEDGSHDYTAEATCILSAMKARGYEFTKIGEDTDHDHR